MKTNHVKRAAFAAVAALMLLALGLLAAAGLLTGNRPRTAYATHDDLIILQTFGGGGGSDTAISHSFIELYNPTDADISLAGYSLDYVSTRTGSNAFGTRVLAWSEDLPENDTVPAGASYLIIGLEELQPTPPAVVHVLTEFDHEIPQYLDNRDYTVTLKKGSVTVNEIGTSDVGNKHTTLRRVNFSADGFVLWRFSGSAGGVDSNGQPSVAGVWATHRPRSLVEGAWTEGVVGLFVSARPTKQVYELNEAFSAVGLEISLFRDDGVVEILPAGSFELSAPDTASSGAKTVTVTHKGFTTSFEIFVNVPAAPEVTMLGIFVSAAPSKLVYDIGETFNASGLVVKAIFSDGSEETLAAAEYALSTPAMDISGTKTVTVTQRDENEETFSASFMIYVKPASAPDNRLSGGAVAAIALGSAAVAVGACTLTFTLIDKKKKGKK